MVQVNIYEAKAKFSELLGRVENGEEVIIARAGRPVARLVGLPGKMPPRVPGLLKGKIHVVGDFSDLDKEIEESFYVDNLDFDGDKA